MADKLVEAYEAWAAKVVNPDVFEAFAGGFTASAVSMRARAMKILQDWKGITGVNEVINKIGALPDIPQE